MTRTITTLAWVPEKARGLVRDLRVRWACEEEGLPYTLDLVDFATVKDDAYRAERQPFGQVPAYADGDVRMFESSAICLHIAEQGTTLLPADPAGRAKAIQWMFAALSSIEPWIFQLQMTDLFEQDAPWSAMRRPKVLADLDARLADLARMLDGRTWLDGDTFTVGDLIMVTVLRQLGRNGTLDPHPPLAAYLARGQARPAFAKALGDQLALYAAAAPDTSSPYR